MKRFSFLFSLLLCIMASAQAQTYTKHLQEKRDGKANVTVTQSREIEELVNSANVSARTQEPVGKPSNTTVNKNNNNTPTKKQNNHEATQSKHTATQHNGDSTHVDAKKTEHADANKPEHSNSHKEDSSDSDTESVAVDMRKKVMRRSYKVNGYRVQVFAGGNSRNDKIKAQNAGNAVKQAFPSQPVYVHFYSPRWICRIGNFRTYEEANAVLYQVKKMGYKQACIVSGKITVAY